VALHDPEYARELETQRLDEKTAARLDCEVEPVRNLRKLAEYLERLPADYRHFEMSTYASLSVGSSTPTTRQLIELEANRINDYALDVRGVVSQSGCGYVACAVGHGPAAGISPLATHEVWTSYSLRVFGSAAEDWCFSALWTDYDNTHRGAAARIRWLLDRDPPGLFEEVYDMYEYEGDGNINHDDMQCVVAEYQRYVVA